MYRDHSNYRVAKIGQNTEISPGDQSTHVFSQTLMKDQQLKLV